MLHKAQEQLNALTSNGTETDTQRQVELSMTRGRPVANNTCDIRGTVYQKNCFASSFFLKKKTGLLRLCSRSEHAAKHMCPRCKKVEKPKDCADDPKKHCYMQRLDSVSQCSNSTVSDLVPQKPHRCKRHIGLVVFAAKRRVANTQSGSF